MRRLYTPPAPDRLQRVPRYEVVSFHGQKEWTKDPSPLNKWEAMRVSEKMFAADQLADLVIIRQYYHRNGRSSFRVLHKYQLHREVKSA